MDMRNFKPGQLQDIAEALRGEQCQPHATPLDHRVNAYRGAVGEVANLSGVNALMLLKLRQPGNDFAAWLIRSRQDFQGVNLVRLLIEHGEIGKGSTNIHANAVSHIGVTPVSGRGNSISASGCCTTRQPSR